MDVADDGGCLNTLQTFRCDRKGEEGLEIYGFVRDLLYLMW